MICADSGGSNGYRIRLWKYELQRFVNETGLEVSVCHARLDNGTYPPKVKISDDVMKSLNIAPDKFHAEWNYTIRPLARSGGAKS